MLSLTPTKRFAASLTLGAAVLLQAPAWAQSPAELAPADTAVFIHVNEPADWLSEMLEGPLGEQWRSKVEEGEGSGDLLAALGMNIDQFMDAYFGDDVVVLGTGKNEDGEDGPGAIFTKVSQADRNHAIDSLLLKKAGDIAGNPVYTGEDGDGYIVFTEDWVAMCDLNSYEYLESVLKQPANAPSLADTEIYAKWTKELPEDRAMTMLAFEGADSQHAMGIVRKGKGLDLTYLGTSPDFDEMMAMLGETNVAEFGPLPADTIAAVTFNIEPDDKAREGMDKLNMLVGGKSVVNDILPKLDTPTVMFMSSVPGNAVDPAVGVEVPVVGMSFKLSDASVAKDLDMMFDNIVMLANVSVMQYEAGLIPQRTSEYGGATFKVAELGKPIALGLEFPELAPMQLVYGVVGDDYVVCTQEAFFKKCVDADKADKIMRIEIEGKPHRLADKPVMAMTGQPDSFASLLLSWIKLFDQKGVPEALAGENPTPIDAEQGVDVVQMLQQYSLIKMQLWTGEDGLVIGRAQLTAPQ